MIARAACLALVAAASVASATNVGTGLVNQLMFLGDASRADRIPLAPAIFNANYSYGMHSVVFQPRPCLHGHLLVDGMPVYEQNLAVLYGIAGEFEDETQLPGSTLTLRLRKHTPPANAPYTREQIVAAVIQLVLSQESMLREDRPLTVAIAGDGIDTPDWAAKYAKPYFHGGDGGIRASVPGVRLETTPHGDRAVVFEGVAAGDPAVPARRPVFLPFVPEGETGDLEDIRFAPVWHGDGWNERLNVLTRPILPYYEKWSGGVGGRNIETAAVAHHAPPGFPHHTGPPIRVDRREDGTHVELLAGPIHARQLAGFIAGCILSEMPTEKHPLTLIVPDYLVAVADRPPYAADPAWKDGKVCEFAIDPKTFALTRGSIPGFTFNLAPYGIPVLSPASRMATTDPPPAP